MRKLSVFNFITLNGFYKGPGGDIGWHRHGGEEAAYSEERLAQQSILLFGRKTYEMMVSFWPTSMAKESFPRVAEGVNGAEKIVFSKTLMKADWNNTKIMKENIVQEIKRMKRTPGKDMTILGSGSIVTQFAETDLIDAYQIMIDPVAIGDGTAIFSDITRKLDLKLTGTRTFKSGIVSLDYVPLAAWSTNNRKEP